MMQTRFGIALASVLALSACGPFGFGASAYPNFSRTPAFHIEGTRTPIASGASQHVAIYRDGARLRVETLTPRGRTIVVFDPNNDAYALTATPVSAPAGEPAVDVASITASTLPVAPPPNAPGVAMRIDDALAPQPLETPWAAVTTAFNLGPCRVAGQRGYEWRATATALAVDERTACITPDGIVLREREAGKTIFEASSLTRGPQPAALFGVPATYQRITPASVAETPATATTLAANTGPAG